MHLFSGTEGKIQLVVRMSESQHHGTFNDGSQAHDFRKMMSKRLKSRQQHHFLGRERHSPGHNSSKRAQSVASSDPPVPLAHSEFCQQRLRLFSTEVHYSREAVFKTIEHWIRPYYNNRSTVIKVHRAKEALSECVL